MSSRQIEVRPFIRSFVRPHGLSVAATPLFVRSVEEMQGHRVQVPATGWTVPLRRRCLAGLARLRDGPRTERWLYSQRELEVIVRNRRSRAGKAQRDAERRAQREAAKEARRAERQLELARHRAARAEQDAHKKALRRAQ
jgi:hypothetical protein